MRRLLLLPFAALALAACDPSNLGRDVQSVPTSPVVLADRTVLDEKALLAAELSYSGAAIAAEIAVDAGVLKGDSAARVQVLNRTAYEALLRARSAYRTANAASWGEALADLTAAVKGSLAVTRSVSR